MTDGEKNAARRAPKDSHLEHSNQDKQAVQLAEIRECLPSTASTGGVPRALVLGDLNICARAYRGKMYHLRVISIRAGILN